MSQQYAYILVYKRSGNLFIEDHKLPIYWDKKVARERLKNFTECKIKVVYMSQILELITHKEILKP